MSIHGGSGNDQRLPDGMRFNSMEGPPAWLLREPGGGAGSHASARRQHRRQRARRRAGERRPEGRRQPHSAYYFPTTPSALQGANLSQSNIDRGLKEVPTVNHIGT
jgi:hypothetical protein